MFLLNASDPYHKDQKKGEFVLLEVDCRSQRLAALCVCVCVWLFSCPMLQLCCEESNFPQ